MANPMLLVITPSSVVTNPPPPPSSMGPLAVSASNPRYFALPSSSGVLGAGKSIFLTGPHTWVDFEQQVVSAFTGTNGGVGFQTSLSFATFLNWFVGSSNGNCIRCWVSTYGNNGDGTIGLSNSAAPGGSYYPLLGSGAPFDLTQYNQSLFSQWLIDVQAAAAQNIYCQIMIHAAFSTGWQCETPLAANSPFQGGQNSNGITSTLVQSMTISPTNSGSSAGPSATSGSQSPTPSGATVWYWMTRYTAKWLDTMKAQPNVIWEIGGGENDGTNSTAVQNWLQDMRAFIRNYETTNNYMVHPCLTGGQDGCGSSGMDSAIISTNFKVDAVSPCGYLDATGITNLQIGPNISGQSNCLVSHQPGTASVAAATSIGKPVIWDTDHFATHDSYDAGDSLLTLFIRGYGGFLFMDECQGSGNGNPGAGPSIDQYIDPPYGNVYDGVNQADSGCTSGAYGCTTYHTRCRAAMIAIQAATALLSNGDLTPMKNIDSGGTGDFASTHYALYDGSTQAIVYTGYNNGTSNISVNLPSGSGVWTYYWVDVTTGVASASQTTPAQ